MVPLRLDSGRAPVTGRLAPGFVTEGSGQDARATGGAGILPAASSFIPLSHKLLPFFLCRRSMCIRGPGWAICGNAIGGLMPVGWHGFDHLSDLVPSEDSSKIPRAIFQTEASSIPSVVRLNHVLVIKVYDNPVAMWCNGMQEGMPHAYD